MGAIERPQWWKLEFRESPERHIVVLKTFRGSKPQFLDSLAHEAAQAAEKRERAKKQVLVFVHGFNVSFNDAARRTGQIKHDLGFAGPAVFYSWPSKNSLSLSGYSADRELVSSSKVLIEQFIADIGLQQWTDDIFLVAHSMGTQGLTEALASLGQTQPQFARKIREIILAAPDIDANLFKNVIAPGLVRVGAPITMYVSKDDTALLESKRLRGDLVRIGDASKDVFVERGIETIDATGLDTSLLGHSYYARHPFLADISSLIQDGKRAADRFYLRKASNADYWTFKPIQR
jgi:esterase/lipase superfamily enzyme